MVFALFVGIAAVMAWNDRDPVEAQHVLATPDDERAMAWIADNTPPDARFLVSAAPAYGDTVVAGEDGGWWIRLLADRETTLPPITYGLEPSIEPGFRESVNALNAAWQSDLDAPTTRRALKDAGVGWAFVGPTAKTLTAEALNASPYWTEVVAFGDARVFRSEWASGRPDGESP